MVKPVKSMLTILYRSNAIPPGPTRRTPHARRHRSLRRWLAGLALVLQCGFAGWAQALVVSATVDTNQVRMGDTLRLTIRIDESNKGNEPDLSGVEKDFKILGTQYGSSTNLSSRGISTESSWVVNLLPKRQGNLTIPAINFDGVLSKPINITVTEQTNQPAAQNSQQLVFLEAEVDASEVYVQQQVNFTLRLYHRTELHDPSLVMPDVEDAVQEKLGSPRAFNTVVDGRDYEVVENRFAFFPQKSGTFVIPPAELNATIAVGGNGFLDPFLGMMGKQIRRQSNGIEIKVRPKPASYPANAPWLPTTNLSIKETLNPDKDSVKVGEPITRIITLEAIGVAPSLLPPLPVPEGKGFKVYPEPADTRSLPDAQGVSSRRVETQAYIPTQPGTLTLPTIEVPFWNVQTDKLDKAVLPGRTLTVTGAAAASTQALSATDNGTASGQTASQALSTLSGAASPAGNSESARVWQWLSLGLLLTWVITLVLWFLQTRKSRAQATHTSNSDEQVPATLSRSRDALLNACKQNHPVIARKALVAWFKQLDSGHAIHSLGHVRQYALSALLARAASELEQTLYRPAEGISWNSDALRKGIADEESQRRIKKREAKSQLNPLHP